MVQKWPNDGSSHICVLTVPETWIKHRRMENENPAMKYSSGSEILRAFRMIPGIRPHCGILQQAALSIDCSGNFIAQLRDSPAVLVVDFLWISGAPAAFRSSTNTATADVCRSPSRPVRSGAMGLSLTDGNGRKTAVLIRAAEAVQQLHRNGFKAAHASARDGRQPAVPVAARSSGLLPERGGNHGTEPEQFLDRE
jgi:hypothetical protein